MKIAVNARLLLKNKLEGIGWFSYETLKRMVLSHPEHQFYFIFDRPYHPDFIFAENVTPVVTGPPSRHPVLWYLWFGHALPRVLKKIKPDVFLSPDGYLPLKTDVPCLPVIHDIAYEHFPETVPRLVYKYYHHYFPRYARKAALIATVSQFSKEDIARYYHISEEKFRVVYNGCNEAFKPVSEEDKAAIRNKWSGGNPYFIFVGGLYPRKNLGRLMAAYESFRQRTGKEVKLLITGRPAFRSDELKQQWENSSYKDDIVFTGRVDSIEELCGLIASSIAMTYVSIFEGFGIPCLEAMRCETAVITSHVSSMPEICDKAARYVDPFSVEDMSAALEELAGNNKLREQLIAEGRQQQQKFSWDITAQLLWDAVVQAAGKNKKEI